MLMNEAGRKWHFHSWTIDSERVDLMGVKEIAEDPPPEPGNQAGKREQRKQNSIGHRQTEAVKLSRRAADLSEANPP